MATGDLNTLLMVEQKKEDEIRPTAQKMLTLRSHMVSIMYLYSSVNCCSTSHKL